jgi:hypothetical protein
MQRSRTVARVGDRWPEGDRTECERLTPGCQDGCLTVGQVEELADRMKQTETRGRSKSLH